MTGESLPVDKGPGDEVSSGTVNQFGAFEMKATKVGDALERLAKVRRVTFDKTGTLTVGIPQVSFLETVSDQITNEELYAYTAAVVLAINGILNPVVGALVHNCGSVFVIINSAFLLSYHYQKA